MYEAAIESNLSSCRGFRIFAARDCYKKLAFEKKLIDISFLRSSRSIKQLNFQEFMIIPGEEVSFKLYWSSTPLSAGLNFWKVGKPFCVLLFLKYIASCINYKCSFIKKRDTVTVANNLFFFKLELNCFWWLWPAEIFGFTFLSMTEMKLTLVCNGLHSCVHMAHVESFWKGHRCTVFS